MCMRLYRSSKPAQSLGVILFKTKKLLIVKLIITQENIYTHCDIADILGKRYESACVIINPIAVVTLYTDIIVVILYVETKKLNMARA